MPVTGSPRSSSSVGDSKRPSRSAWKLAGLAARVGDVPRGRNRISRVTCNVGLHRANVPEELERFAQAAAEEPSDHLQIGLYEDLALWVARIGGSSDSGRVGELLDEAKQKADVVGCPRCSGSSYSCPPKHSRASDGYEEARTAVAEWDALPPRPKPHEQFLRTRIAGLLHVACARGRGGARGVRGITNRSDRLQFVVEGLWTRLDTAAALASTDRAQAAEILRGAAALADEAGSSTQRGIAEQRLRALGVRTWRRARSPTGTEPLSMPDRAGARGRATRRRGFEQSGHRKGALRLPQDGRASRLQRAGQARCPQSHRAGGDDGAARNRGRRSEG